MTMRAARNNTDGLPEEDNLLRKLAASGENLANIAEEINRSPGSVRGRAQRLGVELAKEIGPVDCMSGMARPV